MKYLIVLLVVLAVAWLVTAPRRRLRRRDDEAPARPPEPPAAPPLQDSIVACPQCGLHLPRSEAVPGRGGFFCSEAHRRIHELAHPPA